MYRSKDKPQVQWFRILLWNRRPERNNFYDFNKFAFFHKLIKVCGFKDLMDDNKFTENDGTVVNVWELKQLIAKNDRLKKEMNYEKAKGDAFTFLKYSLNFMGKTLGIGKLMTGNKPYRKWCLRTKEFMDMLGVVGPASVGYCGESLDVLGRALKANAWNHILDYERLVSKLTCVYAYSVWKDQENPNTFVSTFIPLRKIVSYVSKCVDRDIAEGYLKNGFSGNCNDEFKWHVQEDCETKESILFLQKTYDDDFNPYSHFV